MKVCYLLFLCIPFSILAQPLTTGIWKERAVPDTSTPYSLMSFIDSAHGCLFSRQGDYVLTNNGGISWSTPKQLTNCTKIVKVGFLDTNTIIAVDEMNYLGPFPIKLYVTIDFGKNWIEKLLPDSVGRQGGETISLLTDSSIGFLTKDFVLYTSSNLANTWDIVCTLPPALYSNLSIYGPANFVVSGGGGFSGTGFVKHSSDGGVSWYPVFDQDHLSMVFTEYYTVSLGYFNLGYGDDPVRYNLLLYDPNSNDQIVLQDIAGYGALYNNGEYIFFGTSLGLKESASDSTYYVDSWTSSDLKIEQFRTTGREYSWILADSGRFFQRIDLLTGVGDFDSEGNQYFPNGFQVSSYPNPFNNNCVVEVSTQEMLKNTTITVYDVIGRKVKFLFAGDLLEGIHRFRWDGKNDKSLTVSSGVYFLIMITQHNNHFNRLLYLK